MNQSEETGGVALFGAGGAIGHVLARELDRESISYRVVGRNVERLKKDFPNAEAASADFFSGEGVAGAAKGIDTVFYLAGAPYTEFEKHPVMVRHALDGAQAAGVRRFVHVAPVYSYGPALATPVSESQPHRPETKKGRYRLEQEQAVLERNGPELATLVVHLPDFYGPHADLSYANAFMREALAGKTASFVGPLNVKREFIYVPDAAAPLLQLASLDDAYGRCWNLGGQEIGAQTFVDTVYSTLRTKPKMRSVSKFMLQTIGIGVPFMREVAEMYYLFEGGFILDDSALRRHLGDYSKTSFADGIATTIEWMKATPT
ncbi:MAG: NAD(P)H-binding protein [Candidatus Eremiobacteraeota bacterium]|nr:NAD(P)H-binding protein [Candidatus Eremiobacteraeota bacterium]MBV8435499.1 NAD(P)H-binding protein [Candidatus Eremiobacteraeota bacterium]MBV8654502.1 NAD(P)H-binding protein [Candidatus Eremiobacteraeota bacterium]